MLYPWLQPTYDAIVQGQARGHAYLLLGIDGLGQLALLEALTGHWLMTEQVKDHPDVLEVARLEGKRDINVDQIRAVNEWVYQTAHGLNGRVVIIHQLELLNVAAANSLLKTLEEPPSGVRFLLTASRAGRLLPTILSRCQRWVLQTPDAEQARTWLGAQVSSATMQDIDTALKLHFYAPLGARDWLIGSGLAEWRAWQQLWQQVMQQRGLTANFLAWARADVDRFLKTLSAQAHVESQSGAVIFSQIMRLCWQSQRLLQQNISKELLMDQLIIALSQVLKGEWPSVKLSQRRGSLA